jgi:hypothetical protein
MERYKSLVVHSESPSSFAKRAATDNFSITQETVYQFRKLTKSHSFQSIVNALLERIDRASNVSLSRLLFLFYLAINWMPLNELNGLIESMAGCRLFASEYDVDRFRDIEESSHFFFNKVLIGYLKDYVTNFRAIFALKHLRVAPKDYVDLIFEGAIGFEGLFHSLQSWKHCLKLLDHSWPRLETQSTGNDLTYKFLIEIIASRVFEEYIFIKGIFREAALRADTLLTPPFKEPFLCFFEEFVWRNKKITQMYESRNEYFLENLIRFPAIFTFDQMFYDRSTNLLIDSTQQILQFKGELTKFHPSMLVFLSVDYLEKCAGTKIDVNQGKAIFEGREILGFLDLLGSACRTFKKRKGTFTA